MAKYQKKPIIIEAYRTKNTVIIDTLEGRVTASPGDWIITGVEGEQYPCKHSIFKKTYVPLNKRARHKQLIIAIIARIVELLFVTVVTTILVLKLW